MVSDDLPEGGDVKFTVRLDGITATIHTASDHTPEVAEDYLTRAARTILRVFNDLPDTTDAETD